MLLAATTDKIQMTASTANLIHVHASYADLDGTTVTPGRKNTVLTTTSITDVVAAPGTGYREVQKMFARNIHATSSCDVTVTYEGSATDADVDVYKATLAPGDVLVYGGGEGGILWYVQKSTTKMYKNLRVSSDYVNATTSFTDITGFTCAVEAAKHYNFETHLYHFGASATNGPRFGIGGVAMTAMRIQAIITETGSVAAGIMNTNIADVTAVDTAVQATTDGQTTTPVMSIMSGWFQPSAAGTFAIRGAAESAVASALTVKTGSWAQIWEADN